MPPAPGTSWCPPGLRAGPPGLGHQGGQLSPLPLHSGCPLAGLRLHATWPPPRAWPAGQTCSPRPVPLRTSLPAPLRKCVCFYES